MPLASPKYPFQAWAVHGAPDDVGLYALYEGDELICIGAALGNGASDTIRRWLLAHLHGIEELGCLPTHYKWEISSNPLQRRVEYLTRLGPALRCEDVRASAAPSSNGGYRPR